MEHQLYWSLLTLECVQSEVEKTQRKLRWRKKLTWDKLLLSYQQWHLSLLNTPEISVILWTCDLLKCRSSLYIEPSKDISKSATIDAWLIHYVKFIRLITFTANFISWYFHHNVVITSQANSLSVDLDLSTCHVDC